MPNRLYPTTLSKDSIRLMEILPDPDESTPIQCVLSEYRFPHYQRYEALSYCWGDPRQSTRGVICNQEVLNITPNLHDALVRLRKPDVARIMWIDAMCINQADDREKSAQVPLMARVFSEASRVIVWLGNEHKKTVAPALRGIESVAMITCGQYLTDLDHHYRALKHGVRPVLEIPHSLYDALPLQELSKLFDNPWWTRIWCVQEIKLARAVVMIWGQIEFDWAKVGAAAIYFFFAQGLYHNSLRIVSNGQHSMFLYAKYERASVPLTLQRYRRFKATDLRDKVYGLLGLLYHQGFNPPEKLRIVPDYTKSIAAVYTDTAITLTASSGDLRVLAFVSNGPSVAIDSDVPSWVPQWDNAPRYVTLVNRGFKPCGDQKMSLLRQPSTDCPQLELHGIVFGEVRSISRLWSEHDQDIIHFTDFILDDNSIVQSWVDPIGFDTVHLGIPRTLSGAVAKLFPTKLYRDANEDEKQSYVTNFCAWISQMYLRKNNTRLNVELASNASNRIREGGDFGRVVGRICRNRRLFRTITGAYGLGPGCMQAGDVVCVLFGGKSPFLLRPQGDKFQFLGEAYVDEIMDGKLVRDMKAGKVQQREFCII